MEAEEDKTKRIKTSELNKKAKKKTKKSKNGKVKFKDKHPKAAKRIKIGILVFIALLIIGAGVLVGAFVGIFGEELKIDEKSLVVGDENSTVYDADGNLIATLSGDAKRKSVPLSEMSEYLPKAYVAIEDERFYKHSGIDIGRTAYATFTYIIHFGKSSFGGSTITQQVIKNITQDKERTALAGVMRKVKEISKAIQVEHILSKDQILELYLNLIFVGGEDINGVELGSIYYFDKSAKDLSLAECAYMAGINNSPNAYKPFSDFGGDETKKAEMQDKIKTRTKTVLNKMKDLKYITDDQYKEAVAEVDNGLNFKNGDRAKVTADVSYHTEAALNQIVDQIIEQNPDMNRDTAKMHLYSSGYKIYTTQKTDIQTALEEEIVKDQYFTSSKYKDKNKETGKEESVTQYSTPTMVIEDHKTGQIVAAATATGDKENRSAITKLGYLNFPTAIKKQTGSSMKPISVIAPGLETGKITGATVYDDCPTTFGGNWSPKEWYEGYKGLMNMRTAVALSANIPHAKALSDIGVEASAEFCESVGLPDLSASGLSLALGGLDEGVSPAQMVSAYSAIANGGVYVTPTFYTKVEDSMGNVVYEPKKEEKQVMSEQNAYIAKSILTQPVVGAGGTATYCAIPGMDVAAKTGTTNDDFDRWLSGFTPYYTATCWYGYEHNAEVHASGNPAGKIWDAVMTAIHKDLDNAKFERPEGIIEQSVCRISGKLATPECGENAYTELFTESSLPTESCEGHSPIRICNDSGKLATEFCTNVTETVGYLPERERNAVWSSQHTVSATEVPEETCDIHVAPPHQHSFTQKISERAASCTQEGEIVWQCECGETQTQKTEKAAHKWTAWKVITPATEEKEGSQERYCEICKTKETQAIEKLKPTTQTDPSTNTTPSTGGSEGTTTPGGSDTGGTTDPDEPDSGEGS